MQVDGSQYSNRDVSAPSDQMSDLSCVLLDRQFVFILAQTPCSPWRPAWSTIESSHWPVAWMVHQTLPPVSFKDKAEGIIIIIINIIHIINTKSEL